MPSLYRLAVCAERALHACAKPFYRIAAAIDSLAERCAICPDCGRNRYRGAPCKNL